MDYTHEQLEEVWSWIHDDRRCVTTQSIALTLCLSRLVASKLLRAVPTFQPSSGNQTNDASYECVECCHVEDEQDGVKKTAIKLVKSTVEAGDVPEKGMLYSMGLVGSGTLIGAHEKDRAQLRDQLQDEDQQGNPCAALDASVRVSAILPSVVEEVERMSLCESRLTRVASIGKPPINNPVTNTGPSVRPVVVRKKTTAASFFGKPGNKKQQATTEKTGKPPTEPRKQISKPLERKPTNNNNNNNNTVHAAFKRTPSIQSKKVDPPRKQSKEVTKINKISLTRKESISISGKSTASSSRKVGDADDFVGDEDEDEEFLKEEEERRRRNRQREREEEEKAEARREATRQRKEEEQQQQSQPVSSPPGPKRRKRLIEKTSMDSNGYLHTETQVIWEEVPAEEEVIIQKTINKTKEAKKKKTNTKHLKQGNIMGFFKKK